MPMTVQTIAQQTAVQNALHWFKTEQETAVSLAIKLQQIASPTFAEQTKAKFVEEQFRQLGLCDVHQDALHNVYGRLCGQDSTQDPVIVSAHIDTVFPAQTDLTVRQEPPYVHGPGIGDNSTGVAGLLYVAQAFIQFNIQPQCDIWFVANVGEEGLGNLCGMKAVVEKFGTAPQYIVLEGGLFGQISHTAIGVRRFEISIEATGGHSWGSFGNPSAIHELGHLIKRITQISVPQTPKTTFNVGIIEGGTSINTIAQQAKLQLDLRSAGKKELAQLVQDVEKITQSIPRQGVKLQMTEIGHRPAGHISRNTPLVRWAKQALEFVGCEHIRFVASSTDANIPLSQEATAVCIGLTYSANAHRLDEYMDTRYLVQGLQQAFLLTLTATSFKE